MSIKNKISIVGGIPKPIGGVTTFLYRLILSNPEYFSELIDIYPSKEKKVIPIRHKKFGKLLHPYLSIILYFIFFKPPYVYFNFSTFKSLFLIFLLPKSKTHRWALTLHHGDLSVKIPKNKFLRNCIFIALRKFDLLGYLSDEQKIFYNNLQFDGLVLPMTSFLPIATEKVLPPSRQDVPEFVEFLEKKCRIYVISGYPKQIYRHLEVLSVFSDLWNSGKHDIRLVAFLYGTDQENLLDSIREAFTKEPFAYMYWGKDGDVFLSCLKEASAYIRMNSVDSFGLAVAEAITLNVPAIATNVCQRFPGAELVDVDDFETLKSKIINGLPAVNYNKTADLRIDNFLSILRSD